jgi:hypothetical protein
MNKKSNKLCPATDKSCPGRYDCVLYTLFSGDYENIGEACALFGE